MRPEPRHDSPELPPGLTHDLQGAYARTVRVPADREASILAMPPGRSHRPIAWRWGAVAAAAAMVAIVGWVYLPQVRSTTAPARMVALRGDVDHSGRVDILDAFVVARAMENAAPLAADTPEASDLTGDGRIDRADVDALAALAVSLTGVTR